MTRQALFLSLQLFVAPGLVSGCSENSDANRAVEARPVKSVVVRAEQATRMSLPGIVEAKVESDLAFRTMGPVISRKVDVGDLVRKGEVIAEIDPLALKLAVKSAEADLGNAEAQYDNAVTTEKRRRDLASTSAASIAELDLAELGLKSAEAGVQKAQASLNKVREQLGYAQLEAEFDGVVTATEIQIGQTVTAGQKFVTVARLEERDVVVDVPEADLGSIHLGTRFDIALQLDLKLKSSGVVREVAPEADSGTRTYRLKIAMANAPEVFRLGSVVTATVVMPVARIIALPSSAIVRKGEAANVWVVEPTTHTVSLKPVQLEAHEAGASRVRILTGLAEGEEVVVAGVDALAEGQTVKAGQELHK